MIWIANVLLLSASISVTYCALMPLETAIRTTPPKLMTIATPSNSDIFSFKKSHPRNDAQNGVVFRIVYKTTSGTIVVANVKHRKPILPKQFLKKTVQPSPSFISPSS